MSRLVSLSAPAVRVMLTVGFLIDGAVALADATGTWSGTYTETVTCKGASYTNTGSIRLALKTSGNSIVGIVEVDDVERNDKCEIADRGIFLLPASGGLSGTAIRLEVQGPTNRERLSGTMSGNTMMLSGGSSFSATLTRTSSSPPDTSYSGTYSGSHQSSMAVCGGPQVVTFAGAFTITIFHAGGNAAGFVRPAGTKRDQCVYEGNPPRLVEARVVDGGAVTRYFGGRIAGNTLDGFILYDEADDGDEHLEDEPFRATLTGSGISGGGTGFSFTAARTATSPAPVVIDFAPESESVAAGQSVKLQWDVFNATSVSIDNGVGVQPPVGSVTVRPMATTTYGLTAFGADGIVTTESLKVTVKSAGRRRPVRP